MSQAKVLDTIASPGRLEDVTRFVREACGVPPDQEVARLDLIVEELFLNIATYACPGELVHIACSGIGSPHIASVEFSYGGPRFDPTSDGPAPDLDASLADRRIGGLGLFLVREMAESMTYLRDNGVNRTAVRVRMDG
jgi:serine/threonine-protein kinase RsbW